MIMELSGDKIQTNLAVDGHKFSIDSNNPAAFKVLMDGLYKFSVRAIIRELSTNAIDASIQAGRDKMDWSIQLPNAANPMFSIEDHGVGISEKDIYDVYCVLFKSTKNKSNDQTGMFGLGSKTPFAYTRQFVITSSCNGKKTTYSAGYGEDDIPFVTKVGEIDSNDTGLKVAFAVKREDFYKFYEEFSICAVAWPGLPKIIGASEFYDYIRNYKYVDDGEAAFKNTVQLYKGKMLPEEDRSFFTPIRASYCIEMGSVIYAIDGDSLSREANMVISHASREGQHFIIHAPIGAVDITPNREELKYTDKTVEFLNKEIISTFIVGFGAPKATDGYNKNKEYFESSEFEIMKNAQNITDDAQKVLDAALKVQKTHVAKLNKLASFFDKNSFYASDPWNDWKHKTKPFGKMNVRTLGNTSDEFVKRFLAWTKNEVVIFAEHTQKDIDHLNIKDNDYIDSAYFVTKIRSFIKDNISENKNNVQFTFAKAGLYDYLVNEKYFDAGRTHKKIDNFSELKNTYKGEKASANDDPCWNIDLSEAASKALREAQIEYSENNVSLDFINKLVKNPALKGIKKFYIPRIQSKFQIMKESDLRGRVAFKNINLCSTNFYIRRLLNNLGIDAKVIVISSTVNNIRKAQLWSNKWNSFTEYLENENEKFLTREIENAKNATPRPAYWAFEKLSSQSKDIIENLPDTSVFKTLYKGYDADSSADKVFETYNSWPASELKLIDRYSFGCKLSSEMGNYSNEIRAAKDRGDSIDYDKELNKAYPLYDTLSYHYRSWRANEGWQNSSDTRKHELPFFQYIQLVDNQ